MGELILKFDDYIQLNESVGASVSVSDFKKELEEFGWTFTYRNPNAVFKRTGPDGHNYSVYGHLKHGKGRETEKRLIDTNTLDIIRGYLIEIYKQTHNPLEINAVSWSKWGLPNPFDRELKPTDDSDSDSDFEITENPVRPDETRGQRLGRLRREQKIREANAKYKDAVLMPINYKNPNTAYIMQYENEKGMVMYNTCRSEKDRRPLLLKSSERIKKDETTDNKYWFSRNDMRNLSIRYYVVLDDGHLDMTKEMLKESKNIDIC